jgi:hypothetical protein
MLVVPLVAEPEMPLGGMDVHEMDAPLEELLKSTKLVVCPEHIVWLGILKLTTGAGFTVTL